MMLNIPSYKEDPSYRYQMPAMITKVEGRGNGIKTNLVNLRQVSEALRVKTEYPLRFFGFELGSQIEYKVQGTNERCIIKGSHSTQVMQQILDKFIEKYVMCAKCTYPEINILVRKGKLYSDCMACGHRQLLDMRHRISNFILKNPPEVIRKKKEEPAKKAEFDEPSKLADEEEEEKLTPDSPIIQELIKRIQEIEHMQPDVIAEEVRKLSISAGLDTDYKVFIVLKALFDMRITTVLQNDQGMARLLKSISAEHPEDFLSAFASVYIPMQDFHRLIPTALKLLYDNDILNEEFLMGWQNGEAVFNKESTLYSRKCMGKFKRLAQPFLDWLEFAEEESGDEEEEDEEEEEKEQESELARAQRELIEKQLQEQQQIFSQVEEVYQKPEVVEEAKIDLIAQVNDDEDFDLDDI